MVLQLLPFLGYGVALYARGNSSDPTEVSAPSDSCGAVTSLVICCMMWRASAVLQRRIFRRQAAWSALLGAMIFASSDSVIAVLNKFFGRSGARCVIIVTYWLGQLGIVRSVMRAEPAVLEAEGPEHRTYMQRAG